MSAEDTAKRVKELRRQSDPSTRGVKLDDHHITPRFLGGNGDMENNFALTLPEHALVHLLEARIAKNPEERRIHSYSVGKIVQRMGYDELEEFNSMQSAVTIRRRGHS